MACSLQTSRNISQYLDRTYFTLNELISFTIRYTDLECLDSILVRIRNYTWSITGIIGFFSFILMYACLKKSRDLSGPVLLYHTAIVWLEFPHMLVMAESGLMRIIDDKYNIEKTYPYLIWTNNFAYGWIFGDWSKLSVAIITTFLVLERFVAIWFPTRFKSIDQKSIAYSVVISSILIGSAEIWSVFSVRIDRDPSTDQYNISTTSFGQSGFLKFTTDFVYVTKIVICIIIFLLSILVVVGVKKRKQKLKTMSSTAEKEWRSKKRACVFSLIVSGCILIDHVTWVMYRILNDNSREIIYEDEVLNRTYETAVSDFDRWRLAVICGRVQAFTGQLVHGWRFWIYVALNKSTRKEVRKWLRVKMNSVHTSV